MDLKPMAKKVFLEVGHGGSDPGAVGNGLKEKDLTLSIAKAAKDELERHGVDVKLSRKKDENDRIEEAIKECNAYSPDAAVGIHINAGKGDGAEVYYSIYGGTGKTMAKNILAEIVELGQNSRGVKTKNNSSGGDYYAFIRQTKAPAVIVECAFVDNKKDVKIIDTKAEQTKMGIAIAKGILKSLGIKYKKPKPPKAANPADPEPVYRVFDAAGKQAGAFSNKTNAFNKVERLLKVDGKATITLGKN